MGPNEWSALFRDWLAVPPMMLIPGSPRNFSPRDDDDDEYDDDEAEFEESDSRNFFERCADPLLTLDAGHTIIAANDAAVRFFGTPTDDLRGASVLEIDLLARLLTAGSILQKRRSDPPPVIDEVSVGDSEGQPIQCRIEAIPLEHGRTLLHLQDTTALLRIKGALHSAERMHHAVVESLPEVTWTMALPEERLLEISPAVERIFGHEPAAFRQHPELWEELVHPAERERVRAEFRTGLGAARPFEIHFTGIHRDHHDLPHLVNHVVPVADERGWVERCQGSIEDLSAHHRIESELKDAQAHLRSVAESISAGVLIVAPGDTGIEIKLCSRRLAELLRLDETPKPGTPLAEAPEDLRAIARGSGSDSEFERRVMSEDVRDELAELKGPQRVLRRYAAPVRDTYGGVTGRIVTIEDVTSSWLMQRRLTHAQKMESMGRLAGGVAHDFNNLLGNILGFGAMMLEQTPADDPRHDALAQIVQSAERASRLTGALLTFSRSSRFERVPVHLNQVIEESYQLLRSLIDPSVAIELKLDPKIPVLLGDSLLMQQVVVNLVQEVREQLTPGGSLFLSTHIYDRPHTDATDSKDSPLERMIGLEIAVSSTGAREREPRSGARANEPLFDRAGLTLTIAEDIARAHGGYLVAGTAAAPALFRVMLPINLPEEAPLMVADEGMARGHETILVVDDEPGLRILAKTGLQQRGYDVVTAQSGELALEILRSDKLQIDLVMLDLSMPGLSGERVLRAIRGFKPELPVLIASGYATIESQAAWNAAGAQGFVAKPYRVHDLAQKLREILDQAHKHVAG